MTRMPHTIEPTATLEEAHRLMRKHRFHHLPVVRGGDLVGLVSLRDLLLIETLKDVDPKGVEVSETMSKDPYSVAPGAPIDKVAAKMAAEQIGSAVVVDGDEVVGIFTTHDALTALFHVWKKVP